MRMLVQAASLLAVIILAGCSPLADTAEKVDTVDAAVALLQELNDHSTWDTIVDGLDALAENAPGYELTLTVRTAAMGAADAGNDPPGDQVTITVQVDRDRNAHLVLDQEHDTRRFFVKGFSPSRQPVAAYHMDGGQYVCATGEPPFALFEQGVLSTLETYALPQASSLTLSIADDAEDVTLVGRPATRYILESKVPDALQILSEFDNTRLREQVEAAGTSAFTGDLYLDQDTNAILALETTFTDAQSGQRVDLHLTVTQWSNVSAITGPASDQIGRVCQ